MKEELTRLYNTMLTIETKGDNSIVMADCLRFLKGLIASVPEKVEEGQKEASDKE